MRNEEGADGILMSWTSFFLGFSDAGGQVHHLQQALLDSD